MSRVNGLIDRGWVFPTARGLRLCAEVNSSLIDLYKTIQENDSWRTAFCGMFNTLPRFITLQELDMVSSNFYFFVRARLPQDLCD